VSESFQITDLPRLPRILGLFRISEVGCHNQVPFEIQLTGILDIKFQASTFTTQCGEIVNKHNITSSNPEVQW
jgi:hypothetical protein